MLDIATKSGLARSNNGLSTTADTELAEHESCLRWLIQCAAVTTAGPSPQVAYAKRTPSRLVQNLML
jgi:hypothetical protein